MVCTMSRCDAPQLHLRILPRKRQGLPRNHDCFSTEWLSKLLGFISIEINLSEKEVDKILPRHLGSIFAQFSIYAADGETLLIDSKSI